ncbi:FHA domain-containing protein [Thermopirellula anaerolimosa]
MSTAVENRSLQPDLGSGGRRPLVFRVRGSSQDGREVRLHATRISIGSAEGCTLRIRARGVQPVHCFVIHGRRRTIVRPTHDATLLNDRAFSEAELRHGDLLRIGPVVLEYQDDAHESPDSPSAGHAGDADRNEVPEGLGKETEERSHREERLQRREETIDRREEELQRLADALRRREDELATWESRLTEKEKRVEELEAECGQLAEQHRRELEASADRLARAEEAERNLAAKEYELRRWETRIAERETRLQQDEEELRRRVAEVAARERELSDREDALQRKEQTISVSSVPAEYPSATVPETSEVNNKRDYSDPFEPTTSARPSHDGHNLVVPESVRETPLNAPKSDEDEATSLISAKWLRWQDGDTEEPDRSGERDVNRFESGTGLAGDPGANTGAPRAVDSDTDEVDTYMQSLLSRVRGRDEKRHAARATADGDGTIGLRDGGPQLRSVEKNERPKAMPARKRPQAAEKSVDFAAMRELAVLASQGAIDRYAKAKLRTAMQGKLAVMATALGCGLLLGALAWAGRLPAFGVYGIVAAAMALLVYALQYAILSGRLIVNPRGQLQLAERRISREMFKLQTGDKAPLGTDDKALPAPQADVRDASVE